MNAKELVEKMGQNLVGKPVITEPMGGWAGGIAIVTELAPDNEAPEIVMAVQSQINNEEIGVFDDQWVMMPLGCGEP